MTKQEWKASILCLYCVCPGTSWANQRDEEKKDLWRNEPASVPNKITRHVSILYKMFYHHFLDKLWRCWRFAQRQKQLEQRRKIAKLKCAKGKKFTWTHKWPDYIPMIAALNVNEMCAEWRENRCYIRKLISGLPAADFGCIISSLSFQLHVCWELHALCGPTEPTLGTTNKSRARASSSNWVFESAQEKK